MILFIEAPLLFQAVSIGNDPAAEPPLLHDLRQTGLCSGGGFEALTGGLPVTDVVQQFVDMIIHLLLPFHCAPHFDSVADEPLHHKGRLIVPPPQAVEHEHQQDVKLPFLGILTDLLNGVAVSGSYLETGDALFRKLFDDRPSLAFRKFTAVLFLHRDIIFFYLSFGRDSIEAIYSFVFFHDCTLSFLV